MISVKDIERVYTIIDREISMAECRLTENKRFKERLIADWMFVRDSFQAVCLVAAKVEGIIKE